MLESVGDSGVVCFDMASESDPNETEEVAVADHTCKEYELRLSLTSSGDTTGTTLPPAVLFKLIRDPETVRDLQCLQYRAAGFPAVV